MIAVARGSRPAAMKIVPASLTALLLAGCGGLPEPVTRPDLAVRERVPLVFVPGVLGSKLEDRHTGRSAWGKGIDVLLPRDNGYDLAVPLDWQASKGLPRLAANGVVDRVRLLTVRRDIYIQLQWLFEANGYRLGSQAEPRAQDDFYMFSYDYRRSNVASAIELFRFLDSLRRVRGEEVLTVDLMCQSNGSLICRYLSKFGGVPLDVAAAGRALAPTSIRIRRLALAGTSNGGSLRTFREIDRGRQYLGGLGRKVRPEVTFSFRSLYQDLPLDDTGLFLDRTGKPLGIDLYDAHTWQRYGWSVWRTDAQARLRKPRARRLFGDGVEQLAFLEEQLRAARVFQETIMRDPPGYDVEAILSIQNVTKPTAARAVVRELTHRKGSRLLFDSDPDAAQLSASVREQLTEPGDGHATVASQLALSPAERDRLVGPTVAVGGEHHEVVLQREAHHRMLEFFLAPNLEAAVRAARPVDRAGPEER